ncbi:hypothetical protein SMA90_32550, partial [Escherichia coli]
QLLHIMDFFPWGWGSLALASSASGNNLAALGWSLALVALGAALFAAAFLLVKRGFQKGWISLTQGTGGFRRKKQRPLLSTTADSKQLEKA